MATALSPRVWWRQSDPAAIEHQLMALWTDVGREQPVARAVMSNLVVLKESPQANVDLTAAIPGIPLDEIARRHPARILLLYHVRGAPADCPPVAAAVAVTTFGAGTTPFGVETIAVESFCTATSLPSIVRRLTFGDLPTTMWWTDDLSHTTPVAGLVSMARQIVYDSRQWRDLRAGFAAAARLVSVQTPPDIADLNWRRLTAMRSAMAAIVRAREPVIDAGFHAVLTHRPGDGALAHLLAGWIAARMRWPPDRWSVAIEEQRHGDEVIALTLTDAAGKKIAAAQNAARVLVRDYRVDAPIVLPVPREAMADAVAMELASIGQDNCLRDAVLALAAREWKP
jgi:glucose-6-phosphate dehydrogenase assembly protein OpcA